MFMKKEECLDNFGKVLYNLKKLIKLVLYIYTPNFCKVHEAKLVSSKFRNRIM